MILKFLSKYYPHSRALQFSKDILNFWQLPMESVFEAWERFKSCLRKCPDHRIWLIDQIFTFYHGITMVDRDKIMDTEVYYDTTTGVTDHYSDTTSTLNSDESDDDEPFVMIEDQKSIYHLSGGPTPSFESVVESPSPLPTPFEDSDSLKSSGSTTTHSGYSLSDYDAFYFDDDYIEENSSGSTTTHSDFSLPEFDSFIFDLSIDPFPPSDRSVSHHEDFTDELAHIISPPKYDRFYFDLEIVPGEFTRVMVENIFDLSTKGLTINELVDSSLLLSDCDSSLSKEFSKTDLLVSFP
ncbi:hypothetical protein Tco_0810141 [Tanacetum coccineum]